MDMNHWRKDLRRLLHDNTRYPEGWSLSMVDPTKAFLALPNLSLKAGWRWITFQYMASRNGNSITFAFPEHVPDQTDHWLFLLRNAPRHALGYEDCSALLPGAARNFMDSVAGDGSTDAYAQASLLLREIDAIGAYWHGAGWSHCEILYRGWMRDTHPAWKLKNGCHLPRNSFPLVFIEENVAHCRFYDQNDMGGRGISLNEDIFFGDSMNPKSVDVVIAINEREGWFP